MKRILLINLLALIAFAANAQQDDLAPDQNPAYKISRDRYTNAQDAMLANMNTTVQKTYKAYDWYEAKQERKAQRYTDRQERRLYRLQYNNDLYNNYYSPYNNNRYRYTPGYGNRYNRWRFGW